MASLQDIELVLGIGIGATAVLDTWLILLARMGVPTLNFAFIGRWVGHLFRGRFSHEAIARAEPVAGELAWGWLAHYAIGIAFLALGGLMTLKMVWSPLLFGLGWMVALFILGAHLRALGKQTEKTPIVSSSQLPTVQLK